MGLDDELIQYFTRKTGVSKNRINRDSRFLQDLGMDSLDMTETVMELEERYKLKIPDEEFGNMRTIGNVIDYIKEHYRGDDETGVAAKI